MVCCESLVKVRQVATELQTQYFALKISGVTLIMFVCIRLTWIDKKMVTSMSWAVFALFKVSLALNYHFIISICGKPLIHKHQPSQPSVSADACSKFSEVTIQLKTRSKSTPSIKVQKFGGLIISFIFTQHSKAALKYSCFQ